jgi:integration host factor subunit beta
MNKSGLIEALSRKENLTEKKAIDLINLVFKGFTSELRKKGSKSEGLEASSCGNMTPIRVETPRPEKALRFHRRDYPSSKSARSSKRGSTRSVNRPDAR